MDYQSYEATITSIVDESPSVKSFGMSLSGPNFDFFPGQYIDLFVDTPTGIVVGGYSITSSPIDNNNNISNRICSQVIVIQSNDENNIE